MSGETSIKTIYEKGELLWSNGFNGTHYDVYQFGDVFALIKYYKKKAEDEDGNETESTKTVVDMFSSLNDIYKKLDKNYLSKCFLDCLNYWNDKVEYAVTR